MRTKHMVSAIVLTTRRTSMWGPVGGVRFGVRFGISFWVRFHVPQTNRYPNTCPIMSLKRGPTNMLCIPSETGRTVGPTRRRETTRGGRITLGRCMVRVGWAGAGFIWVIHDNMHAHHGRSSIQSKGGGDPGQGTTSSPGSDEGHPRPQIHQHGILGACPAMPPPGNTGVPKDN
jgi:hypothetical protein